LAAGSPSKETNLPDHTQLRAETVLIRTTFIDAVLIDAFLLTLSLDIVQL